MAHAPKAAIPGDPNAVENDSMHSMIILVAVLAICACVSARLGELDLSFNKICSIVFRSHRRAVAVSFDQSAVIPANGKIVMADSIHWSETEVAKWVLARLNPNGGFDSSCSVKSYPYEDETAITFVPVIAWMGVGHRL